MFILLNWCYDIYCCYRYQIVLYDAQHSSVLVLSFVILFFILLVSKIRKTTI